MSTPFSSQDLRLRDRYHRSVDLVRDFDHVDRLSGYVVTSTAAESFRRLLQGLGSNSTQRAWSLVGPYGAGKSAFALFASAALDYRASAPLDASLLAQLERLSPEAAGLWGTAAGERHPGNALLPVLIVGDRQEPLASKIASALIQGIEESWSRGKKIAQYNELLQVSERIREGHAGPPARDIAALVLSVCEKLASSPFGGRGILLIIDEFGKHLEGSVLRRDHDDAFLMQALGESAARSGTTPLVVLTIQHQNVEAYAANAPESVLNEWRKVAGRFEQINYQESAEQMFALLARAFVHEQGWEPTAEQRRTVQDGSDLIQGQLPTLGPEIVLDGLRSMIPIHPITAVALPILFKRLGQHERSLFAFVASTEPGGLVDFCRTSRGTEWYRIHHLYDYVWANFRASLLSGPASKRWAELEDAVGRHSNSPDELAVLKTVGLLGALGELSPVRGDKTTIAYCLEGSIQDPLGILHKLVGRSVVVERAFSQSYALWEGSDVDIDERLREAAHHVSTDSAKALADYLPPRSVVARRQSIQTGTLRYFDVAYANDLAEVGRILERTTPADGTIVLFLRGVGSPSHEETRNALLALPRRDERPVLLAIIEQPVEVRGIVSHIEQLEWVRRNTPALAGDAVARREIDARRRVAEQRLHTVLGGGRTGDAVHAFAASATWYNEEGEPVRFASERDLNHFLSVVCGRTYRSTPEITNELLNRRSISAAAAKAQKELLGAMVDQRGCARLGIEGSPPELSMYYSLLERPGLHVETRPGSGVFRYTDLREHENAAWRALGEIVDDLLGTAGAPLSLNRIVEEWKKPPFGLKAGVLPILLAQVLLSREDELALYEGDMFVPELSAPILERMSKEPKIYSVRSIAASGLTPELFQELATLLHASEDEQAPLPLDVCEPADDMEPGRPGFLRVIRPLVQAVAGLPEITRNTAHVSPQAREIRDAVLRTSDPLRLVFVDFARVLAIDPVQAPVEFTQSLRRVLQELRTYYDPRVLDEVYDSIIRALGENPNEVDARARIVRRAQALFDLATEQRLKSFLFRLSEGSTKRNAWCESVASLVAHKPPQKWRDGDIKAFTTEIGMLGRRMQNAEAAAFEHIHEAENTVAATRRVHVAATTAGGEQFADVVRLSPNEAIHVEELAGRLRAWLFENVGEDSSLRKAVLAQGWQQAIEESRTATLMER